MSQPNWIIIKPNQKATYKVNDKFPYYLQMGQGSTVTIDSNNGGPVTIEKNIWGPGNLVFKCNVTMNGSIGSLPAAGVLT